MTESGLVNLLVKVSVKAIFELSKGSLDPITVQESIEESSYRRPILSNVQILESRHTELGEKQIKFFLSPDYLSNNIDLAMPFMLDELIWKFTLPPYDYGEVEEIADDESGTVTMQSEEGLVEWLTRGFVEIVSISQITYEMSLEDFYHSLIQS